MRPNNVKLICFIGLLLGFAGLTGCGSGDDVLDVNGQKYSVSNIAFSDADDDNTLDIDAVQDECDGNLTILNDGGTPGFDGDDIVQGDDAEPFTNVFAAITLVVPPNTPGLTLDGYTVEYIGEASPDGLGNTVLPPDLIDLTDRGSNSIDFPPASTTTFTITCLTIDTKNEFLNKALWSFGSFGVDEDGDGILDFHVPVLTTTAPFVNRYTIRITLFFTDEFGEDVEIQESRTIFLSSFDNC